MDGKLLRKLIYKFEKGKKEYKTDLYKDYTEIQLLEHILDEYMDAYWYIDALISKYGDGMLEIERENTFTAMQEVHRIIEEIKIN